MKYIFWGSPEFAAIILENLIKAGLPPMAVVASPDRPAGRKKALMPPPVKRICLDYYIKIHQPENVRDLDLDLLLSDKPEFFVVAAYAKIIPEKIISLPPFETVGIHPSLLPKYRGPSPIQSMILEREEEIGVTIYKLDSKVDHGPIIHSERLPNYEPDTDDYISLESRLAHFGSRIFSEFLPRYLKKEIVAEVQDEDRATYTKKFETSEAFISENELIKATKRKDSQIARMVLRKILAFSKEPGAWTILDNPLVLENIVLPPHTRIKLLKARIEKGEILILETIQCEGKGIRFLG